MYWPAKTQNEIKTQIFDSLRKNITYRGAAVLGVPASYLDENEFSIDFPILRDAPFLNVLVENPNHIGCHTHTEEHIEIFDGTIKLEKELIKIVSEQIFQGEEDQQDGYVASGGTEANIEAFWIYRNYFLKKYNATNDEIALVYSKDSHYSMPKGANLLGIKSIILDVDFESREIIEERALDKLSDAIAKGVKYFIQVINLSTTMFGSIDSPNKVNRLYEKLGVKDVKMHLDAAFGGFYYPFLKEGEMELSFLNPLITSISVDGHKMLQTPYGTGIFLIRKGYMEYVKTEEANYIPGKDYTLCGSRSGANAIAIWMLLFRYGSEGMKNKIRDLNERTSFLCAELRRMGVRFYRNPNINIIAIRSEDISATLAKKFHLVADTYDGFTKWWKIVIMPHVRQDFIEDFCEQLAKEQVNHN